MRKENRVYRIYAVDIDEGKENPYFTSAESLLKAVEDSSEVIYKDRDRFDHREDPNNWVNGFYHVDVGVIDDLTGDETYLQIKYQREVVMTGVSLLSQEEVEYYAEGPVL